MPYIAELMPMEVAKASAIPLMSRSELSNADDERLVSLAEECFRQGNLAAPLEIATFIGDSKLKASVLLKCFKSRNSHRMPIPIAL